MGPSSTLVQGWHANWARVAVDVCDAHGERASAARPRQRFRYTRAFLVGSLGSLVSKPLLLRVLHQVSLLGLKSTLEDLEPASVLALIAALTPPQKQGCPRSLVQAPASHLQPPVQVEEPPYATCKVQGLQGCSVSRCGDENRTKKARRTGPKMGRDWFSHTARNLFSSARAPAMGKRSSGFLERSLEPKIALLFNTTPDLVTNLVTNQVLLLCCHGGRLSMDLGIEGAPAVPHSLRVGSRSTG
jgi:hypothetical protein